MPTIQTLVNGVVETNTYIIYDAEGNAIVIDPATTAQALKETIANNHLQVSHILLTHAHFDHIGGIDMISELCPKARLMLHEKECAALRNNTLNRSAFFGRVPVWVKTQVFATLEHGDIVHTPLGDFKTLYTGGHAPGGISFYYEDRHCVFTGDALFFGGIGRTDFENSDFDLLFTCIQNNLYTLPDETIVYPGHGPESTIGYEKKNNGYVRAQ